jgi:hypothetical protein
MSPLFARHYLAVLDLTLCNHNAKFHLAVCMDSLSLPAQWWRTVQYLENMFMVEGYSETDLGLSVTEFHCTPETRLNRKLDVVLVLVLALLSVQP